MISVRLPPELERELNILSKETGKTRTDIVKESLVSYIDMFSKIKSPYELGKDLFGTGNNGDKNLSVNRKKILKQRLLDKNEKRHHS
jgi:RHH-type transcriptional regulator, rel operon repressor / antitoxin RelB